MPLPEQDVLQTADVLAQQRNPGFETENLPSPNGFTAPQAAPIPIPGTGQTMGGTSGSQDYLSKFNQSILGTKDKLTPGNLPGYSVEDVYNPRYRSVLPGEDSEEAFAKGQSGWKQFGNALVKMGATAVGTFLSGMAAIPDTISSIAGNSPYDTSLGNNMDEWLDNLENKFPNYYTKWEQAHPFASALPGTGGFANFWGDKFLKNLGFTAGAIGSAVLTDLAVGAVTEGIGEIPLVGQQIGKAALWLNKVFTGSNRAEELLTLGRAAGRTGEQLLDLKNLANAAAATKVTNGAKYAIGLYGATASEAGFEARDGYNSVKNDLLMSYQREKGYSATGKDLEDIEKYARASGNVRFGVNMALLGVSNALQLDGILKSFSAAKAGVRSSIQRELESGASIGLAEGSIDTFERLPKTLWGRVRPLAPSILSEGVFEEGGQYATQVAAENYYERKYLYDKGLNKTLYKKDETPFDSRDAISNVVHSVVRGLADEFTTDEGLENVVLGSLTGAMFGGVTRWMDRNQNNALTQTTLNMLNSTGVTGVLQNQYDTAATSQRISEDMKEAVRNNDIYKYKNFQHEQFVNFITSGIKAGRFDVRLEQLNMLRGMDNDEFKKAFGLDRTTDNVKTVNEYVDALVQKAEKVKKSYDVINDTFTNPFTFNRKAQTKEQNEENQKYKAFEDWKGSLTYLASINADVDSRLQSIASDLRSIDPHLDQYHVGNFTNRDYLKAYKDQLTQEAKGLQSLIDQKVSGDPEADAKRAKSLNTKASLINIALTDPNFTAKRFEGLFSNLLNFHLNGQNDTGTNRIPQEAIPKLIEYGRDVNRLKIQRESAYEAFDKISTEEGFNRYFKEVQAAEEKYSQRAQENEKTATAPTPAPTQTGGTTNVPEVEVVPTVQVKNAKGETKLYEQGKEHFINLEGKPGANPTKVAVLAQNQDGTVTVSLPDGSTQDIPADNFFMPDTIGDEIQEELDANTSEEDVPPPAPGTTAEGDMKKDLLYGPYSTTDPVYSRTDIPFNNFHKRHQNFLFDMGSSNPAVFNQDNKPRLRIIPVTAKTYKALGFPDNFITDNGNNADESVIRAVYVIDRTVEPYKRDRLREAIKNAILNKQDIPEYMKDWVRKDAEKGILDLHKSMMSVAPTMTREQLGAKIANDIGDYVGQGLFFADSKGYELGRVGEPIDPNQAIFSTFTDTDFSFQTAPGVSGPRYTNKEDLNEEEVKNWWRDIRSNILDISTLQGAMQRTYDFTISRGIPNVIEEGSRNNPIEVGLIKEIDLDKPIITVPTLGEVAVLGAFNEQDQGVSSMKSRVKMPLGTPLLNYGGNLVYLNARKFTSAEANNIFEILKIIADRSRKNEKSGLFKYLHKVIYMVNVEEGMQSTPSSIAITKDGKLYLGTQALPIDVNPQAIEDEKGRIIEFLEGAYHSIKNSEILKIAKDAKGNDLEFSTVKIEDGQITTGETYKNYNHYLLNSENPPFAVNLVVPQENERPLIQKYSVIQSFDFDPAKFKRPEQPAPKVVSPITVTDLKSAIKKANADLKAAGLTEENIDNLVTAYEEDPKLTDEQTSWLLSALDYLRSKLPEMNKQQGVQEAPKVETPKEEAKKEAPAEEPEISFVEQQGNKLGFVVTQRDDKGNITDIDPQGIIKDDGTIKPFANKEKAKGLLMGLLVQSQVKQDDTTDPDDDEGLGGGNFKQGNDRYRIISPRIGEYKVGNLDEEFDEVRKIVNGDMFIFRKVDELLKTTGGGLAWGALQDNMIYIYKNAEVGTTYHEAFEAVWYHFVTGRQQQEIYDEFKTRKGTFTTFDGKTKSFSNASLKEAKEQLAEEFRDYKLTNKLPKQDKQKSFFRRLLDFIKWLFGMSSFDRNTLFDRMNKGFYRNFTTSLRGPMIEPEYSYYREPGLEKFNETTIQDMLQGMTAEMFGKLFGENSTIIDQLEENFETTAGAIYNKLHSDLSFYFEDKVAESGTLTAEYGVPYQRLLKEGKTDEAKVIRDQVRSIRNEWKKVNDNWDSFVREHMRYLRVFNIEFIVSDDGDIELTEDMIEEDENKNMQEYGADPLTYDAKNNASNRVKLLIASIADSEWIKESTAAAIDSVRSRRESSSMALPKLVQYAKLFNYLLHNTAGINGIYNIWDKLTDMTESVDTRKLADANVRKLMSRVKFNNGFSGKTNADWRMILSLEGTLTKMKPAFFRQFTDYRKNTYFKTTVLNSKINQVKSAWISRVKGSGAVKPTTDNKFVFSKNVANISDPIAFLNKIGIDITKADVRKLKGKRLHTFDTEVNSIRTLIQKAANAGTAIPIISSKQIDFDGRLSGLAELYVTYMVGDDTQSQHPNLDGEQTANFVLNNVVSTLVNDATNSASREEFENKENNQYFKTDLFHKDSMILNKFLFDEKGEKNKGKTIEVGVVEGRQAWDNNNKSTSKLTEAERQLYEINNNINGVFYTLLPADAKTEWALNMGTYWSSANFFGTPQTRSAEVTKFSLQMYDWLITEINLAKDYENRKFIDNLRRVPKGETRPVGKSLRFFKDILPKAIVEDIHDRVIDRGVVDLMQVLSPDDMREQMTQYLLDKANRAIANLTEWRVLSPSDDGYQLFGFDKAKLDEFFGPKQKHSEEELRRLMVFREMNYVTNGIEMHKFFFGDPAQYKDELKRIKTFLSGREYTHVDMLNTSEGFNQQANIELNKTDRTQEGVALAPGDPGYQQFKNHFNTISVRDVFTESNEIEQLTEALKDKVKPYSDINENDGGAYMMATAYREMLWKSAGRWSNAQEKQFQWEMAWERNDKAKDGLYTYSSEELRKHDEELLKEPENTEVAFPILKLMHSGLVTTNGIGVSSIDKASWAPLFYRWYKGTSLGQIHDNAQKRGVDYIKMESAHKVGLQEQSTMNMYNEKGEVNSAAFDTIVMERIPAKLIGIQVEQSKKDKGQTEGSQLRKIAIGDLRENGVPIDYRPDIQKGISEKLVKEEIYKKWNALEEDQKRKASPIYSKIQRHNDALVKLTLARTEAAMKRMGMVEEGGEVSVPDKKNISDFILAELERRELPRNIAASIQVSPETRDFSNPLEANPQYGKIRSIIYSVLEKTITRPKVNGGQKTMLSVMGIEKGPRIVKKQVNGQDVYTSDSLKFYTRTEDGTQACEIMLPYWFGKKLQEAGSGRTKEEVLKYLNGTKEGKELLRGIGFRIPTQGLNSVDFFVVKDFLPEQMGDVVIMPSEITAKAGSDFDIDKLNVYLKNYFIDGLSGLPKMMRYKGSEEATKEYIMMLIQDGHIGTNSMRRDLERYIGEETEALEEYDIFEAPIGEDREFNAMLNDTTRGALAMYYQKALENEYFDSIEALLSLNENYARLTLPNDASQLKGFRNKMLELKGTNKTPLGEYGKLLDSTFMMQERQAYMSSKQVVGISAVSQTAHAIAQNVEGGVVVNDRSIVARFPHNTINGKISMSGLTTAGTENQLISNINSQTTDGGVDVAKDKFLAEMGINQDTLSTFLTLIRMGANPWWAILFLNQPSIQQFLKAKAISASVSQINPMVKKVADRKIIAGTKNFIGGERPDMVPGEYTLKQMEEMISAYAKNPDSLTQAQRDLQIAILDDFIRYDKRTGTYKGYSGLAWDMFHFYRGYNWDTARINDPNLVRLKKLSYQKANDLMVTPARKVMESTFIGAMMDSTLKLDQGLRSIINVQHGAAGSIMDDIAYDVSKTPGAEATKQQTLLVAEMSLVDYAIQTNSRIEGDRSLNTLIPTLILSKTATAEYIDALKLHLDKKLSANPMIKGLVPHVDKRSGYPSTIEMPERDFDTYTSNVLTDAFRELRDDEGEIIKINENEADNRSVSQIYKRLVLTAMIQSGTRSGRGQFAHLIPSETYTEIVSDALRNMQLGGFQENLVLYRTNWNNNLLVPFAEREYLNQEDEYSFDAMGNPIQPEFIYMGYRPISDTIAKVSGIAAEDAPAILTPVKWKYKDKKVIKIEELERDRDTNQITGRKMRIFRRVDVLGINGTQPLEYGERLMFVEINPWGDTNIREFYNDRAQSVLPTNNKVFEVDDDAILYAVTKANVKTNAADYAIAEVLGKFDTSKDIDNTYDQDDNEENEREDIPVAPRAEVAAPEFQEDLRKAADQYLAEELKKEPKYYWPVPKDRWGADWTREEEDSYYNKPGVRITLENLAAAQEQNSILGDQIGDNADSNRSHVSGITDPYDDYIIVALSPSVDTEYAPFNKILDAYAKETDPSTKEAVEKLLKKYGLGKYINNQNPNQLSFFQINDFEEFKNQLQRKNCK